MIKSKRKSFFYGLITFIGILSIIWEITIYRKTFIDLKILFGIILIVGLLSSYFTFKYFNKLYGAAYSRVFIYFWSFIQSTISWGFLACTLFMSSNYYLSSTETKKQTFEIKMRASLAGRKHHSSKRKPTFSILYEGKTKEAVFNPVFYKRMNEYQKIELEIKEGLFGFDVIHKKTLLL